MSQFAQHYERLHDEALIELALRQELVPEATAALHAELQKRGINDLSAHAQVRQREAISEDAHRRQQISHRGKVTKWRTKFLYAMAVVCVGYGVFRILVPNVDRPGDDGGIMLVLGVGIYLFALLSSRLSRLWSERVLHRPPAP
ncbi:hypothetical protein [Roseateles sp.]|uniref:hypothetical protein n=1 Tax=Roseateles sp. TaxID=1971397 RepID=UPI00326674E8